nr:immunoglobulin light chain junction region [Macaca mulatta]
CLLYYSGAYIF